MLVHQQQKRQYQWQTPFTFWVSLILLLLAASCTPKTQKNISKETVDPVPTTQPETEVTIKATDTLPVYDGTVIAEDDIVIPPHVAIRIEKTACFGKCPVFEIKVFSDGRAQYNGKFNAPLTGLYEAYVEEAYLQTLFNRAEQISFFTLSDHYPTNGKYLSDLPNTTTYLNNSTFEKSITRNHDGPLKLRGFEDHLIQSFLSLNWQKMTSE